MRQFVRPLILVLPILALAYWEVVGVLHDSYYSHLALFRRNTAPAEVVMLGDSTTEFGDWEEQFPGIGLLNRGIAGDTSGGVLARLDDVIVHRPRSVFLMIGVNDLTRRIPVAVVQENIAGIVGRLKAAGAVPTIESVLFLAQGVPAGEHVNREIARLNVFLKRMCAEQSLNFIDLNAALAPEGYLLPRFTHDGTHLTGEGYRAWRDEITPLLVPGASASASIEGGYAVAASFAPRRSTRIERDGPVARVEGSRHAFIRQAVKRV